MKIQSSIAYPAAVKLVTGRGFQVGLVVVTLFLTLYYNVAYYWYTPVTGVQMDYVDNTFTAIQLVSVLPGSPGQTAGLQAGDRLLTVDGQAFTTVNRPLYTHKSAGESVQYVVERGGQRLKFDVIVSDYFQHPEYLLAMLPVSLLSLLVYALGLILFLFSAPQDTRARLVGAVWLLAGLVLAAGGPGWSNGGWFAVDVYLTTFAVGSFVSLAAHLYFPAVAFSNRARLLMLRAHLALVLLALAAYAWQRISALSANEALPPEAFVSGAIIRYIFILTWLVNLALLLKNCFAVRDGETRRQAGILLLGTLLGVLPALLLTALPNLALGPQFVRLPGNVSVLMLVCIPVFYGYVIGQRRLLRIDRLFNRFVVWFILSISIAVASGAIWGLLAALPPALAQTPLAGGVICALAAMLLAVSLHGRVQVLVDRTLYHCHYDFASVTTRLAEHLSRITDRRDLDGLLKVEFAKQLHIRESKLLLAQDDRLELPKGAALSVADDDVCQFLLDSRQPARAISVWAVASPETAKQWAALEWGRVFAPIAYNGALHGVWVLGDRLNGNYYSEQDMENIKTVSQWAALALASLAALEALRGLGQRLAQTDEEHLRDMARELHDDVLGDLTVLHDQQAASQPELAAHLGELAAKVRQVIDKERAYLFEQGIVLALEALIDNLEPLAKNKTNILRNLLLPEEPVALDYKSTTALYRIVQEALSNVLKHANADTAVVTLRMDGDTLEIEIWDDGIGMEDTDHEPSGHYGLLGMRERAAMIGATLTITSVPGQETTVLVRLKRGFDTCPPEGTPGQV